MSTAEQLAEKARWAAILTRTRAFIKYLKKKYIQATSEGEQMLLCSDTLRSLTGRSAYVISTTTLLQTTSGNWQMALRQKFRQTWFRRTES